MIDRQYVRRLEELEKEQVELMGQAAVYRLQVFNAIEGFVPRAAKLDTTMALLRYAREHMLLAGTLMIAVAFVLRKRIGMLELVPVALRIGSQMLAR